VKVVFFGTSPFAARIFSFLIEKGLDIVAVVTRPDKPKGRSQELLPPPVKERALQLKPTLPIYQPVKASTPEFASVLKQHDPDLFVVVAYGEIIKTMLLELPKSGCINIHASLLPKYRGAAPIQRVLMAGEKETGVCIMDMVLEMDAGDIYQAVKMDIPETMTFGELDLQLSELAGPALLDVIRGIEKGLAKKTPQNHAKATLAPKLKAEEEKITWSLPAHQIHNLIRALSPTPGAWCWVDLGSQQKRLKIKRSEVVSGQGNPGESLIFNKHEWVVACGKGALRFLEVQLEGKKTMPIEEFLRGLNPSQSFKTKIF
jgi:methionyl-tRNA formyltransferase